MSSTIDVIRAGLIARGIPAFGEMYGLSADPTTLVGQNLLKLVSPERVFVGKDTTGGLYYAKAGMLPYTGRQDTLLITPESHSIANAVDWSLNNSNIVGMYGDARQNQRSRFGHSANIATFLTVSGYGNCFADLYFMHGRGSATNATLLNVTGTRNTFLRCHFGGPMHATEAGTAAYRLVKLAAEETFFKDCVFGVDTIPLTAAIGLLELSSGSPRAIFENCLFLCSINAAGGQTANFIKTVAGIGEGLGLFRGCSFVNIGSAAMTLGIDGAGLSNYKIHMMQSSFVNTTDVVAAAQESYVTVQSGTYTASALANGLAPTVDYA